MPVVSVVISPIRDSEGVIEEFDAYWAVEPVAAEVASPRTEFERAIDAFRTAYPDRHELEVEGGRVARVHLGPTPLGAVLDGSVGERSEDLPSVLVGALGEMVSFEERPGGVGGATRYSVSFQSADGVEQRIEAFVVPTFTHDLGPADSVILLAEVD